MYSTSTPLTGRKPDLVVKKPFRDPRNSCIGHDHASVPFTRKAKAESLTGEEVRGLLSVPGFQGRFQHLNVRSPTNLVGYPHQIGVAAQRRRGHPTTPGELASFDIDMRIRESLA